MITSQRGLQYLHVIYSNEQLKSSMQELFIILLGNDATALDLHVDTLQCDQPFYIDCVQQLFIFMNLPILSLVYGMAKQNQELVPVCDYVRPLSITI